MASLIAPQLLKISRVLLVGVGMKRATNQLACCAKKPVVLRGHV